MCIREVFIGRDVRSRVLNRCIDGCILSDLRELTDRLAFLNPNSYLDYEVRVRVRRVERVFEGLDPLDGVMW
jgi:hypothetical protein